MKREKLYYVPGLISIIGLPILIFFFGPEDPVYQTVLRFTLASDAETPDSNIVFSKYYVKEAIKNKKLITIDINDEGFDDYDSYILNSKFDFIHKEIEKLQFSNDTSTILKIQLGEASNYDDFVWLVNQMTLFRLKRYALMDDGFYVLSNPPAIINHNTNIEPLEVDTSLLSSYKPPTKWELLKRSLEYKFNEAVAEIKHSPSISIRFVALIFIPSVLRIRRIIKTG